MPNRIVLSTPSLVQQRDVAVDGIVDVAARIDDQSDLLVQRNAAVWTRVERCHCDKLKFSGDAMLIGQLAKRTDTSERLLRYYERVGLLASTRLANGYREYDEAAELTVRQIRLLLAAGLSTSIIKQILPCAKPDGSLSPCPGVLDKLRTHLGRLDERAAELARARITLQNTITTTEGHPAGITMA